jgi:hypothetical protein
MRSLCFIALLVSAPLATAQSSESVESLAGCYELRIPWWSLANPKGLPRRFLLTTRRPVFCSVDSAKKCFVARNLDSKVHWDFSALSSWTTKDDGTLQIVWSTGFLGYDIQLIKSGTDFRGTAHYFTDTPPDPRNSLVVIVRRAECKDGMK